MLEACNLFKLNKVSENDFTLILGYDVLKKFIRTELEDIFSKMGCRAEMRRTSRRSGLRSSSPR